MVNLDFTTRALNSAGRHVYQLSSALIQNLHQSQSSSISAKVATLSNSIDETQPASTEYLVRNWFDALFTWFQIVVLWHDPLVSICTLGGLFSSFLLLIYFAPRFYATIMIAIFIYNLTKVWFRHVWPEIRVPPAEGCEEELRLDVDRWTHLHPHLMTLTELNQVLKNLMKSSESHLQNLLALRREKPAAFCLVICSTLSCTAYIGNRISGFTLLMSAITTLVLAPGVYLYLLPDVAKEYLKHSFNRAINFQNAQLDGESPNPPSSSVSSSSPNTMLSLFEHLRGNSFIARQLQNIEATLTSTRENSSSLLLENKSSSPIAEVPIEENDLKDTLNQQARTHGSTEKINCDSGGNSVNLLQENQTTSTPRRSSDDLSSNESTSLIDLEDDQQDGFVML